MLARVNRCTCNNPEVDPGRHPFASPVYVSIRSVPLRGNSSYGRDDNGFIRDDHRNNGQSRRAHKSLTPTRNGKQVKSPKTKGANSQHKRRNSRQRKQRNQNSKTEGQSSDASVRTPHPVLLLGTPLINGTDLKLTLSHETNDDDKHKHDSVHLLHTEQPLPPRDHDHKENDS
jgi:hypothetical protein